MARKKNRDITSSIRIASQFKGMPVNQILLIQTKFTKYMAYTSVQNLNELKKALGKTDKVQLAFNKPLLTPKSAKGQGRLAYQYIEMLDKMNAKERDAFNKKYSINCRMNDYNWNLIQMDNDRGRKIPPVRDFWDIITFGHIDIGYAQEKWGWSVDFGPQKHTMLAIKRGLQKLPYNQADIQVLMHNGVMAWRFLVKVQYQNGTTSWQSTKTYSIMRKDAYQFIDVRMNEIYEDIDNEEIYESFTDEDGKVITLIIDKILKFQVYWTQ